MRIIREFLRGQCTKHRVLGRSLSARPGAVQPFQRQSGNLDIAADGLFGLYRAGRQRCRQQRHPGWRARDRHGQGRQQVRHDQTRRRRADRQADRQGRRSACRKPEGIRHHVICVALAAVPGADRHLDFLHEPDAGRRQRRGDGLWQVARQAADRKAGPGDV